MTQDKEIVEVRKGEEIDIDNLNDFLTETGWGHGMVLQVQQFPGGFSNLTYLLKTENRQFVLRRPPKGANIKTAHDMSREFRVLKALKPVFGLVPEVLLLHEDANVLGAPFYIMEKIEGHIIRPSNFNAKQFNSHFLKSLSEITVETLVKLHALDTEEAGLNGFGKPEGYAERQVNGWMKRYFDAQTDEIGELQEMANWLSTHIPGESGVAFIHNDFKYDNLVVAMEPKLEVRAVLDWEMATVGDPLMDLGTTLAYWSEKNDPAALKQFNITSISGNYTRQEVLERYQWLTGTSIANPVFYYVFGLFKVATIAQQIYKRFTLGHTRDPRFGALIHVVKACGEMGTKSLEHNTISFDE